MPGKREFTYRFVQWQAERAGVTLRFPPAHPFNPLAALRLCIAAGSDLGRRSKRSTRTCGATAAPARTPRNWPTSRARSVSTMWKMQ